MNTLLAVFLRDKHVQNASTQYKHKVVGDAYHLANVL